MLVPAAASYNLEVAPLTSSASCPRSRSYESKLATLSIIHKAVQNENASLRTELELAQQPGTATEEELSDMKEEFSRRLGSADQTIGRLQASTRQPAAAMVKLLQFRPVKLSPTPVLL